MLLVVLGVAVLLILVCCFIGHKNGWLDEPIIVATSVLAFFITATTIGMICCASKVIGLQYIDDKIEMYQEQNIKIEQQVSDAINIYMQHESDVYGSVKIENPESAITIVAAYPELNSSELIKDQINIYNNNSNTIKTLMAQKIDGKVYKWWLYFG